MSKLDALKNVVTSKAGRQILSLQKSSPTILFGAGIVGVVATAVLASRATLKLEEVLYDHKKDMQDVNRVVREKGMPEDEGSKIKALVYVKTTQRIMKMYGPALGVGALSVAALTGSHHIMSKRNAGLAAAYSAVDKAFGNYRARVQSDLGEDADREFMYGKETRETTTVKKNGEEKTKTSVHADSASGPSMYAVMFGRDTSQSWSPEAGHNIMFLKAHQSYANDKLKAKGHVFLNEIYDALGLPRTPAGQVVGWVKGNGDNYIDFGIFNKTDMSVQNMEFFTGVEDNIWLDFNVDGVVYDLI
jgi:uncharacterized protein DUF6353